MYTDLLEHIMTFVTNIKCEEGLWREHIKLLKNLEETVHLFYMPEIHNILVPVIFEFVIEGNTNVRDAAAKCLA